MINVSFFLLGFSSSICYFQVERSIRNIRNGLNPTDETTDTQPKDASSKRDNKRETLNMLNVENITLTDELIEKIPDEYFQRTVKVVFLFRRRHTMKAPTMHYFPQWIGKFQCHRESPNKGSPLI